MRIGHASTGNNVPGDQTGKEVCVRSYYSKPWTYVLRAKNPEIAEKIAVSCEKGCANQCIGYSQAKRNTLRNQAVIANWDLSKIKADCDCDCSSFMTVCAESAGIRIPYNGTNAPTTRTMESAFLSTGMFTKLTDSKYLNKSDYLMRGDILVVPGSHTVMILDNGAKATQTASKYPTLSRGTKNDYVLNWQMYLMQLGYAVGSIDGIFGIKTETAVKQYQTKNRLPVNGIIDDDDWKSVGKGAV